MKLSQKENIIELLCEKVVIDFSPTWCKIVSDNSESLHNMLHNELAYKVDGYFFSPKYKTEYGMAIVDCTI